MISVFIDVSKIIVTMMGLAIIEMQPCKKIRLQKIQLYVSIVIETKD